MIDIIKNWALVIFLIILNSPSFILIPDEKFSINGADYWIATFARLLGGLVAITIITRIIKWILNKKFDSEKSLRYSISLALTIYFVMGLLSKFLNKIYY